MKLSSTPTALILAGLTMTAEASDLTSNPDRGEALDQMTQIAQCVSANVDMTTVDAGVYFTQKIVGNTAYNVHFSAELMDSTNSDMPSYFEVFGFSQEYARTAGDVYPGEYYAYGTEPDMPQSIRSPDLDFLSRVKEDVCA